MKNTRRIPGNQLLDRTLAAGLDGYEFILKRCRRHRSDVFQTRLLFQPTICLHGADAAELFYDHRRFCRARAAPRRAQRTLLGTRTIQSTDDAEHRHRKDLMLSFMTDEGIRDLVERAAARWRDRARAWEQQPEVVLFLEAGSVLARAVTEWTGLPVREPEFERHVTDIRAVIEGAGAVGPRHWRGRRARQRADAWMQQVIEEIRAGRLEVPEDRPAARIAHHRGLDGRLMDAEVAGQELFNLIRPTVAVDRFITFAALALHQHPAYREVFRDGPEEEQQHFVQEVRRYFPFFPFAVARTREAFTWREYPFPKDVRVLLDLYGTDHDPRIWGDPEAFRPERFRTWDGSAFNFIPQGGGDHRTGHRCPGEWITIELMKDALRFLVREVAYDVPPQDFTISLKRMPAIPRSRFVMTRVRAAAAA